MVYQCENCDKVYKKKGGLQQHIKVKHSRIESLQCIKCDKYFVNKYKLRHHLYKTHPSKLHSCIFCGSSFKASRKYLDFIINWYHIYGIF
jgi:NAD-dependent SIR2 family protein deacetylase